MNKQHETYDTKGISIRHYIAYNKNIIVNAIK